MQKARLSQEDARKLYDSLAKVYDIWGKLTESRARNRAIELAEIRDGQAVLEVAVGTGLAFCEIVRRNPGGINRGLDISAGMLEQARARMRRFGTAQYELKAGSAVDLPYANSTFDLLVNNYMFDLLAVGDMRRVLSEFRRVLKKEGRLVLANMTEGERFGSGIYDRIYRRWPKMMGGCRSVRMSGLLREAGFHVLTREYHQQALFPSEVIVAKA